MREFLFGNVQIGVKSQGLIFKALCMELGTPHETQSYLHYQAKIQIWEWGRERFREEKDRWNPIYKPMLHIPPLLDVTFSIRASLFFFSLCLCCVCVLALFFFFFVSPFLFHVCDSLYSQKNSKETVPLFSSQLISSWSSLSQFFFHNS